MKSGNGIWRIIRFSPRSYFSSGSTKEMASREIGRNDIRDHRFTRCCFDIIYFRSKSFPPLIYKTDEQTLPLKSFFPAVSHIFTRLESTYRRHANVLDGFLKAKLAASRAKAKTLGMSPFYLINVLEVPLSTPGEWW
jgi:hypothetical protein